MKKRILASLMVLGLFNGFITQAAANAECPHVSMTRDVNTVYCGGYPHQYVDGYYTLVCQITLTQDIVTYTCTSCGEIVDTITHKIDEYHSKQHD